MNRLAAAPCCAPCCGALLLLVHAFCAPPGAALHVKVWDLLGPFPVGKTEIDADPIAACCGGIENLTRGDPAAQFFSELGDRGLVRWSRVQTGHGGFTQVHFPGVNWNQLVQWTDNQMVLETQSHLVGDIRVPAAGMYLVHAARVHSYVLGGRLYHGDIYSTGQEHDERISSPVYLAAGKHTIYISFRAKAQGTFSFRASPLDSEEGLTTLAPATNPDLSGGLLLGEWLEVPVVNLGRRFLSDVRIELVGVVDNASGGSSVRKKKVPLALHKASFSWR
jgi:hypothetical protein